LICLGIESTAHTIGVGICKAHKVLSNEKLVYKPPKGEGIMPRKAADHHAKHIGAVLQSSLDSAGVSLNDIDLFAFSQGPGIGQCLRVSCAASKFLASKYKKPVIGINHCHAHLEVSRGLLGMKDPLYVYVSGANTQLIISGKERQRFLVIGETLDIGLGNLLDVFARQAGFKYAHGSQVAKLAESGKYFSLPYTVKGMNFAFAGLLTSAVRYVGIRKTQDICCSVVETAFAEMCEAAERALCLTGKKEVTVCGGVAQNKRFCQMLNNVCKEHKAKFGVVAPQYNADNGAMIAYTGVTEYKTGKRQKLKGLCPNGYWRIDEVL